MCIRDRCIPFCFKNSLMFQRIERIVGLKFCAVETFPSTFAVASTGSDTATYSLVWHSQYETNLGDGRAVCNCKKIVFLKQILKTYYKFCSITVAEEQPPAAAG